jgi:hypothetical protein
MAAETGEPSRTALGVAMLRAFHQLYDASPKILDDPLVLQLLRPQALDRLRADRPRYQTPGAVALRAHVLLRTRYAEDRLQAAVARGLRIFEVDQPASQEDKRRRLEAGGIELEANLDFVPIDFETTSIAEGLRSSELVFTFSPRDARPAPQDGSSLAELAARAGEPFRTRIASSELTSHLSALGFASVTIPSGDELDGWYTRDRGDDLRAGPRQNIVSAVV